MKFVRGKGGSRYNYDRRMRSPGVDFRWEKVQGMSAEVAEDIPHARKVGPQTLKLRRQLKAMPDGGVG